LTFVYRLRTGRLGGIRRDIYGVHVLYSTFQRASPRLARATGLFYHGGFRKAAKPGARIDGSRMEWAQLAIAASRDKWLFGICMGE